MNYNDSVYFILDDENHINNNEIKSKDNNIYYLLLDDETDIKTLTCVNITKSMKKNKICNLTYSGINKILIDDRPDNIEQWRSKGGIGILHTNTADTLKQLQAYGL